MKHSWICPNLSYEKRTTGLNPVTKILLMWLEADVQILRMKTEKSGTPYRNTGAVNRSSFPEMRQC